MAWPHPAPGEILFGTAPGFDLNGRSTPVPESEYYTILIDETLFAFSFVWGQVLAAAQVPKGEGSLTSTIKTWFENTIPRRTHDGACLHRMYESPYGKHASVSGTISFRACGRARRIL